jgi:hypothetical protein
MTGDRGPFGGSFGEALGIAFAPRRRTQDQDPLAAVSGP